jgi:tRNA 5-methylaminomethyl-2-thiouridine biosynthesis bifunctional protein
VSKHTINNAILDWNDIGTPVSNNFDDVYFSNANGLEEARYVFIQQNHLPERWPQYDQRRFTIAETGFGTGLNFLAAWQQFRQFRNEHPNAPLQELHFISFEKFPVTKADLEKAHQYWPELAELAQELRDNYPIAVADCQRIILDDGLITLDLWFGDIKDCMPQIWMDDSGVVDAWFLDGFAPSKNPEMWNQNLFNNMASLSKANCSCATFTAAGFVRRGLIESGFDMKKVKGFGTKREMIAGTLLTRTHTANHSPWLAVTRTENTDDIAIIGGGIASATLAQSLVRRKKRVTLYCCDSQAAMGASGNKQGAVYPLLHGNLDSLARFFAPAFVYARHYYQQAANQIAFDHEWCGVTQLSWDEKSARKNDKIIDKGFTSNLVTPLTPQQTNQTAGVECNVSSIHYPLGGWLCPQQLTQGLFKELELSDYFSVVYDCDITKMTQHDTHWCLEDSQGSSYRHSVAVVANGHKIGEFEQSKKIPGTPVRGQVSHIATTKALSEIKTVLCYDGYLTPANKHNKNHCIGASYNRFDLALTLSEHDQQDNQQRLEKCLPDAKWVHDVDTSTNQARVSIRCASRDHMPFVGNVCRFDDLVVQYRDLQNNQSGADNVPVYRGLYALVGLGSRGLSSAPLLGEMLASQICGDPLPMPLSVIEALHPGRMWVRKLLKGKAIVSL